MTALQYLVVIDPAQKNQPALERAIQASQLSGAKLHLFECVNESYNGRISGNPEQRKKAVMTKFQHQLAPLVDRVKLLGIDVSQELVWANDWSQAIISAANRNQSDMVFKSSFIHSRAERAQKTADWALLRDCPQPILLMHHNSNWEKRRVLAAVNMLAKDDKHIALNNNIINTAHSFAQLYDAAVHFINAYPAEKAATTINNELFFDDSDTASNKGQTPALNPESLAKYCKSQPEQAHIVPGPNDQAILSTADTLGVDLIIIGSVKRRGIKGRVIGNTAEKLLDRTSADILTLA